MDADEEEEISTSSMVSPTSVDRFTPAAIPDPELGPSCGKECEPPQAPVADGTQYDQLT